MFSSGSVGGTANYVLPNAQPIFVRTANPDETERIEKTFPLNANGRVAVSNVNGSINIRGWDRNEVQVVAVKIERRKIGSPMSIFGLNRAQEIFRLRRTTEIRVDMAQTQVGKTVD